MKASRYRQIVVFISLAMVVSFWGCSSRDERDLRVVVDVIPRKFFSGTWIARDAMADNKHLSMLIDLEKDKLVGINGIQADIVETIPVDNGYALLLYDSPRTDYPHGLHSIVVLKKTGDDSMVLIGSPGVVNRYVRKRQ